MWMFAGVSWGGTRMRQLPSEFTVKVITNRDDGSFVVKSIESKSILGRGSGKIAEIKFSCTQKVELQVEFLDVIVFDQGKSFVLKAPPSSLFTVEANQGGEYSVVGNYNPEPKGRSQQ